MSLMRTVLLAASRNPRLSRDLPRRAFVKRAVRRFMPGEDVEDALGAAARFKEAGIGAVLTELGEQIASPAEADAVREHYLDVLGRIKARGLPAHVSLKLTHLGLELDREACVRSVLALAASAAECGSKVWIDMEESSYVDATLEVFRRVRQRADVGICLQAYLRRTPADLAGLLPLKPAIRLVKGAYNEPAGVAFPKKRDTDAAYAALGATLLEAATRGGALPVFGTHDMRLVSMLRERATSLGVKPGAYEVHMLYGIREGDQRRLAAAGVRVRVLVSYGSSWFPWYMRRLAERPANVWFVVKNLL